MEPLDEARRTARDGAETVESAAETVTEHPVFEAAARGGFVMSGLVHVLIGWIALRVALSGSGQDADQSGALRTIASAPGGVVLLWLGGAVMVALTLWHLAHAWFGAKRAIDARERFSHLGSTLGKAVVYGALGATALRFATGGGSDSGEQTSSLTAGLLGSPGGRVLVIAVGLAVGVIGGYHIYKGASRRFEDELRPTADQKIGAAVTATGMIGYIAKGVALLVVGVLFGWAALGSDPEKATGLDGAVQTIAALPAGAVLLCIVGAGLMLYGVYSVLCARYASL